MGLAVLPMVLQANTSLALSRTIVNKVINFLLNFHRHNLATNSLFYSGVYARVTNYMNWIQSNIAVRILGAWGKNLRLTDGYTLIEKFEEKREEKNIFVNLRNISSSFMSTTSVAIWSFDWLCTPWHHLHVLLFLGVVNHHDVQCTQHTPANKLTKWHGARCKRHLRVWK